MPFSTYRVLLVDDNEDDYVIIRDLLDDIACANKARDANHVEVEWVNNLEDAYAALTRVETPYDVCLLDYTLGPHTGLELLQLLPADNPIPVIMLTGSEDHEVDVRAALAGAADYLLKGHLNAPLLERSMRYALERGRRETERAKREANLQEVLHQSQLLATAVSNLTDGMVVTDARQKDNPIILCNPAFYAMTGYSPDEVVGRNCRFLQGPNSDPHTVQEMREAIQQQRAFSGVIRNYRKDGTAFWNGLKITPVFDAQGQLSNFVGLQTDVTIRREAEIAQKEAERALQESRENLAKAQQVAGLGSWKLELTPHADWSQNRLLWSDQAFRLLGYEPREVKPSYDLFLKAVHPEDVPKVEGAIRRAVREQRSVSLDHRVVSSDGTQRVLQEIVEVIFDASGTPIKMVGTLQDITARIRDQQAVESSAREILTIWESMSDAFVSLDLQWRFTHVNSQAAQLWHKSAGELVGRNIWEVFPAAVGTRFYNEYHRAVKEQVAVTFEAFYAPESVWRDVRAYPSSLGLSIYFRDITDRKGEEEELHFQKALLEAQTEASLDGILVVSAEPEERRILSFNQRLVEMWGIPPEIAASGDDAAFRKAILDQVVDRQQVVERANSIYQHPTEPTREEVVLRNGSIFDRYSTPITDAGGSYQGRVWYFRDITEARQAERELRQSEARFQNIVANVPGMVYQVIMQPDGAVEWPFVSDGSWAIYEAGPEMIKQHPLLPFEVLTPEDRFECAETVAAASAALLPWKWEGQLHLPSGTDRWIQVTAQPQRLPDGATLWDGLVTDITARKEAHTALLRANDELELHVRERTAQLQASNQTLMDNKARLLQGNSIFTDLTRLRVTSEVELQDALEQITLAGSRLLEVERCSVWLFNENRSALRCWDLFQSSNQEHSRGNEIPVKEYPDYFRHLGAKATIVAEDAHTHPATHELSATYLTPLGIASLLDTPIVIAGEMVGVLWCDQVGLTRQWQVEDQTFAGAVASICALALESLERTRAEALLRQAKEEAELAHQRAEAAYQEAERANLAKSEFLSRMSHELRTPLNAILGFGQILERQELSPMQREGVGYILKGGHHLLGLINEVLDIVRVEAGHIELSPEPVALSLLVEECCSLVHPLAQENEIELIADLGHPEIYVMADQQRLKQVVLNLLSNAIKYNQPQGQVKLSVGQAQSGQIQLRVADTGHGLTTQQVQQLFTPFERLHAANSSIQGTGLGLVISQRLIIAMKGSMGVESELGKGSTFWIRLPSADSPMGSGVESLPSVRPASVPETARTYTVLSIEDNLSNIRLLEVLLATRPEITLLTAMQGHLGLDLARQHRPDLMLLDLHLPDLSGAEVLELLQQRSDTSSIPVIVVSADATAKQIERLLAAGASAYLTKPLDVARFLETLDDLLQKDVANPE